MALGEEPRALRIGRMHMEHCVKALVVFVKDWSFRPPLHTSIAILGVFVLVVVDLSHSVAFAAGECDVSLQLKRLRLAECATTKDPMGLTESP